MIIQLVTTYPLPIPIPEDEDNPIETTNAVQEYRDEMYDAFKEAVKDIESVTYVPQTFLYMPNTNGETVNMFASDIFLIEKRMGTTEKANLRRAIKNAVKNAIKGLEPEDIILRDYYVDARDFTAVDDVSFSYFLSAVLAYDEDNEDAIPIDQRIEFEYFGEVPPMSGYCYMLAISELHKVPEEEGLDDLDDEENGNDLEPAGTIDFTDDDEDDEDYDEDDEDYEDDDDDFDTEDDDEVDIASKASEVIRNAVNSTGLRFFEGRFALPDEEWVKGLKRVINVDVIGIPETMSDEEAMRIIKAAYRMSAEELASSNILLTGLELSPTDIRPDSPLVFYEGIQAICDDLELSGKHIDEFLPETELIPDNVVFAICALRHTSDKNKGDNRVVDLFQALVLYEIEPPCDDDLPPETEYAKCLHVDGYWHSDDDIGNRFLITLAMSYPSDLDTEYGNRMLRKVLNKACTELSKNVDVELMDVEFISADTDTLQEELAKTMEKLGFKM